MLLPIVWTFSSYQKHLTVEQSTVVVSGFVLFIFFFLSYKFHLLVHPTGVNTIQMKLAVKAKSVTTLTLLLCRQNFTWKLFLLSFRMWCPISHHKAVSVFSRAKQIVDPPLLNSTPIFCVNLVSNQKSWAAFSLQHEHIKVRIEAGVALYFIVCLVCPVSHLDPEAK